MGKYIYMYVLTLYGHMCILICMKNLLNGLALVVAIVLLVLFVGMVLTPTEPEVLSKEQERYYFLQGCEEEGSAEVCACIYDDTLALFGENHITDNIERMANGDFTDEEVALSANCWLRYN